MRLLSMVAAAVTGCVWAGAAAADWAPTRWGMSMADVMRVMPAASSTATSDAFNPQGGVTQGPASNTVYLYARVERQGRSYDVRLGFAGDKLKSVEFAMVNATERQCDAARNSLQSRYGTPESGGSGEGGRFDGWKAPSDRVVFIYRSDPRPRCLILMSPLDPGKSGAAPAGRGFAIG